MSTTPTTTITTAILSLWKLLNLWNPIAISNYEPLFNFRNYGLFCIFWIINNRNQGPSDLEIFKITLFKIDVLLNHRSIGILYYEPHYNFKLWNLFHFRNYKPAESCTFGIKQILNKPFLKLTYLWSIGAS